MSARSEALPRAIDQGGKWFWNFIRAELAPYPGRAWVVARMTLSATIVMVLVMTFRIPGGFQGAIFTLIISRENPAETFFSGFRTAGAFLIGTLYTVFSIRMQYFGTHLLHHRAFNHRLLSAEAGPAAERRSHRRVHLWNGSSGVCAPLPRHHHGIHCFVCGCDCDRSV